MADTNLHLAVVGGGPGGYAAAFLAADLGLRVTLIDPELNPGGVCLYRGCIPSKALLHVAKTIDEATAMGAHGVAFGTPKVDLAGVRGFKDSVVKRLTNGLAALAKQRKVTVVTGQGKFTSPNSISVETATGPRRLTFRNAIIVIVIIVVLVI